MLFTLIPSSIVPTYADDSLANGVTGTYIPSQGGPGNPDWNKPDYVNGMWGYKISVRYAKLMGYEMVNGVEEPVYDWENSYAIGKPVYFRAESIGRNNGQEVTPAFYGSGSVYDIANGDADWNKLQTPVLPGLKPFTYYIPSSTYAQSSIDKSNSVWFNEFKDRGLKEGNTQGHKELQDWLNRVYNMELNPNFIDDKGITTIEGPTSGAITMTSSRVALAFPPALPSNVGQTRCSETYLKSYFLSPTMLNMISWYTCGTSGEGFSTGDFLLGVNKGLNSEQGTYKIYIEPVAFRMFDGSFGVMTFHEAVSQYILEKNGQSDMHSVISALGPAGVEQWANAFSIEKLEPSLNMDNSDLVHSYTDSQATNINTGLGAWVLSSPSLNSYVPGPKIIKTYAQITGIDGEGNLTLKEIADSELKQTVPEDYYTEGELLEIDPEFNYQGIDNEGHRGYTNNSTAITNIPKINIVEHISNDQVVGTAVLNDIVGTNVDLNDTTSWENEELPKDEEKAVEPIATDVKGLTTGLVTGSEVVVDAVATLDFEGVTQAIENLATSVATASTDYVTYVPMSAVAKGDLEALAMSIRIDKSIIYDYWAQVQLGKINRTKGVVEKLEPEKEVSQDITDSCNVTVLRYIVVPEAIQKDVIEVYYEETGETEYRTVDPRPLDKNGDTVNIQVPEVEVPEGAKDMEIVEWVTNPELPLYDISTGTMPPPSNGGLTGNTLDPIPGYPEQPVIHNLYVKWRIVVPSPPEPGTIKDTVPEWRLSKYRASLITDGNPIRSASMNLSLTGDSTTHVTSTLSPSGTYNFDTINPNGQKTVSGYSPDNMNMKTITTQWLSAYSSVPANTFYHSKAIPMSSTTVSHNKPYADILLDGNLNQIKSFDTAKINAASWLTNDATVKGLEQHNIKTDVKPIGYNDADEYDKSSVLKYGIYNKDTYTHQIAVYYHTYCGSEHCSGHCECYLTPETFSPPEGGGVSYQTVNYNMMTTFERYVQKNTDSLKLKVSPVINKIDTLTTIKYQLTDTINVYPEIGMLFDNDKNDESIKWVVGDQARKISPVVWQTLDHKVYVVPTSSGTSVATDSRAITKAQSLGEANKQVIHKGAGVNTTFQLFRDSDVDSKAILTVKTFALDFASSSSKNANILLNGVDVKSAWGNGNYNSQAQHDALISAVKATGKADATEKLLVDINFGGNAEYVGGEKKQKTADYKVMTYDGKEVNMFEHQLIVRGGSLIAVGYNDRSNPSGFIFLPFL